jgi:hypothetical protein
MSAHATRDRCDIIHLAGRLRLSPALLDGAPTLVPVGDQAGRCGWEPFFAALDRAGLWVIQDEGGTVRLGPRAAAPSVAEHEPAR